MDTPFKFMQVNFVPEKADLICSRVEVDLPCRYEYVKSVVPADKYPVLERMFRDKVMAHNDFRLLMSGVVSKYKDSGETFYGAKVGEVVY